MYNKMSLMVGLGKKCHKLFEFCWIIVHNFVQGAPLVSPNESRYVAGLGVEG